MLTEELINQVEQQVLTKNRKGLENFISEVYILTTLGGWVIKKWASPNDEETRANILQVSAAVSAMAAANMVMGMVQVTSAWILDGQLNGEQVVDALATDAKKKEVLMFNGAGPLGTRIRVYEIVMSGDKKMVGRLMGAFDSLSAQGGE